MLNVTYIKSIWWEVRCSTRTDGRKDRHCVCVCMCVCVYIYIYRVSQEERARLRKGVPYVKLYRYNPKHLYPKLNGYGDNGQRSLKL